MSRIVRQPVAVRLGAFRQPLCVVYEGEYWPVLTVGRHWREWIGVLANEPERDIWQVEIEIGVCEIHFLKYHTPPRGQDAEPAGWQIYRWED